MLFFVFELSSRTERFVSELKLKNSGKMNEKNGARPRIESSGEEQLRSVRLASHPKCEQNGRKYDSAGFIVVSRASL